MSKEASYFFTLVTERRAPLFSEEFAIAIFEEAQAQVQSRHPFEIEAQVILPDHLHALWQLPPGDADFSGRWRLIKSTFTHRYLKIRQPPPRSNSRTAKKEQSIWQRRYWEHLIRDDEDFAAHLDYIHYNPVHHGLASAPIDWPHSTFMKWISKGAYDLEGGSNDRPKMPSWAGKE